MTINALLPNAKIDIFTNDAETRDLLYKLQSDWRFARVTVGDIDGGIEQAVERYTDTFSPDLLIIQTKDISDNFTEKLEVLSGFCAENTSCLIIGPLNDVQLYRKLSALGISDYLVAPVTEEDMMEAIGNILLKKHGQQETQLISVLGSKGGCGTSSIAQMIGESLSDLADQKTLLLDAAGAWTDLPIALSYEPTVSLHELVEAAKKKDEDALERMIIEVSPNLHVAATGAQKLLNGAIEPEAFEQMLNYLIPKYPYIVLDLSGAPEPIKSMAVRRAQEIILVTDPQITSLRATRSLRKEIKEMRGGIDDNVHLILNRAGLNKEQEASIEEVKAGLEVDPDLNLPYQPKAFALRDIDNKKLMEIEETKQTGLSLLELVYPEILPEKQAEKTGGLLVSLGLKKAG